jgi:hypothetical protein
VRPAVFGFSAWQGLKAIELMPSPLYSPKRSSPALTKNAFGILAYGFLKTVIPGSFADKNIVHWDFPWKYPVFHHGNSTSV